MLATDLVARGLDFKNVDFVINFNLPREINKFVHRVGRTARAGSKGASVTFVNDREFVDFKKMVKKMK